MRKALMFIFVFVFLMVLAVGCASRPEMNKPVKVVAPGLSEPNPQIPYEELRRGLKDIDSILASIVKRKPALNRKGERNKERDIFNRLYNGETGGLW